MNIPDMISAVCAKISESGNTVEAMSSKSKKDYAYSMLDAANDVTDAAVDAINAIDGVIRVRVIK